MQAILPNEAVSRRWWHTRMMWLVVGGPTVVVIASFITLALCIIFPDPVIEKTTTVSADSEADGVDGKAPSSASMQPALKARNHAATGGQ